MIQSSKVLEILSLKNNSKLVLKNEFSAEIVFTSFTRWDQPRCRRIMRMMMKIEMVIVVMLMLIMLMTRLVMIMIMLMTMTMMMMTLTRCSTRTKRWSTSSAKHCFLSLNRVRSVLWDKHFESEQLVICFLNLIIQVWAYGFGDIVTKVWRRIHL